MQKSNWQALCAYMESLWHRQLTMLQTQAGWNLLKDLPDEAVEGAVVAIAESGRETMPPWPLVYKTGLALAEAIRAKELPQLPGGDSLTDLEHDAAMVRLRAKETPEQRRRADRMTSETKSLPMGVRIAFAGEMLQTYAKVDASSWDRVFDERLAAEEAKVPIQREIRV